jgi:EAL domain-containing protein (putative c-di-GMP-specific phosphodiesterase class I)
MDSREYAEIARAVCVLAGNLDINVVAIGVETAEQVEFLRTLNCGSGQGYLFSRPLPAADIPALLAEPAHAR